MSFTDTFLKVLKGFIVAIEWTTERHVSDSLVLFSNVKPLLRFKGATKFHRGENSPN